MKRYGVRPSVCVSQQGPTAANPLLDVCCCGPGGQEISIDCCSSGVRRANAGSATLSAYAGSWTPYLLNTLTNFQLPGYLHSHLMTSVTGIHFYRAMLCIRGTSHGPVSVRPSVCLSVTSRSCTKTAKRMITLITPHDSPGTLVFRSQRSPPNSTGVTPCGGAKCRWGGSKSATFDK